MNTIDITKLTAAAANPSSTFDHVLSRLQKLSLPSQSLTPTAEFPLFKSEEAFSFSDHQPRSNIDNTFFLSCPRSTDFDHNASSVIDTFVPRRKMHDLSPTSSQSSSDLESGSSHASSSPMSSHEAFFTTCSRVVRLYNLPAMAESFLSAVFLPHNASEHQDLTSPVPVPATLWELQDEFMSGRRDSVWAVFRCHEEACAALALSGRAMSVATALESDLEPFHKLRRVLLRNPASSSPTPTLPPPRNNTLDHPPPHSLPALRVSSSLSDLQSSYSPMSEITTISSGQYTLSSNPPNPKTSFRLGDWICSSPKCGAHNFGRNLACIGCGCPRSGGGSGTGANGHQHQTPNQSSTRTLPSPRFSSPSNNVTYYSSSPAPSQNFQAPQQHRLQQQQQQQVQAPQQQPTQQHQHLTVQRTAIGYSQPQSPSPFGAASSLPNVANPPKSSHPLLTPSGRAFAIGGKVQNVSSDPLSPCIMYWPDNEPFPEQGQIRPSGLVGIAQPPILNTGNRGPISHQPGDWICQKCNYLNWRRRKVCQTCLPYAEGNGDSISAAVQAERIALLTSVLSQTQISGGNINVPNASQAPRSHSLTPPQARRPFIDLSASAPQPQTATRPVHRSQSHFSLGQQYATQSPQYTASSPIYQTSGHREPSPLYSTGPDVHRNNISNTNVQHNSHINQNLSVNYSSNIHSGADNVTNHGSFKMSHVAVQAPAPLLPSFLQDMVQSPALSPTSTTTSSADLSSIEEYEEISSPRSMFPRARGDSGSSDANSAIANIWRLDGEESKSLSAFPLPNQHELIGGRKNSPEKLRV